MWCTGVVVLFDGTGYTAVVELRGSRVARLAGVPVSRAIAAAEMTAGRRALVWLAEDGVVGASCVVAVWG